MQLRARHFKIPVPEKPLFKMLHGIFLSPATWMKKKTKQTNKQKQETTKKLSNPTNKLIVVECFTFKESVLIERDVFFLLEDEPHLLFLDPGCPSEVGVLGKDVP